MTRFSTSASSDNCGSLETRDYARRYFDLNALFGRVERFEARRNGGRTGAVTSVPRRLDAKLLEEGEDFEAAWAYEVAALIAMKRCATPEADAIARTARAATARLAARIEAAHAITLDGLKVKARAILCAQRRTHGDDRPRQAGLRRDRDRDAGVARSCGRLGRRPSQDHSRSVRPRPCEPATGAPASLRPNSAPLRSAPVALGGASPGARAARRGCVGEAPRKAIDRSPEMFIRAIVANFRYNFIITIKHDNFAVLRNVSIYLTYNVPTR